MLNISKTLFKVIVLSVLISSFGVAFAHADDTLFFDGFESNDFSAWDTPVGANFAPSGGTCRMGPDHNVVAVKITGATAPHGQILKKSVSTVGFENIKISFCFKWDVLENGDSAVIEYTTDGSVWNVAKTIDNSTVDHMMYAADNTEIATSNGVGQIPTPFSVTLSELATHSISLPASTANKPSFAVRIRENTGDGDDYIWIDDFRVGGTAIVAPPQNPSNLILNPSLETPSANPALPLNWFTGGWGTNTRTFTYPVAGQDGTSAAKIDVSQYTNGDAKWYFKNVAVSAGQTYSFSDWYMSNVPTYIAAQLKMNDGTFSYLDIASAPASPSAWQKISANFTVPSGVVEITIFHIIKQVGSLSVDNYFLSLLNDADKFDTGKISLTFDDAWSSIYTNAIPMLNAAGFKSTQYIISGYLNTDGGHMSSTDVLSMQASGHEISAHTKTHPNLTTLNQADLQTETGGSRRDLVLMGASPVGNIAYPEGGYNDVVKNAVKNSGFLGARSVDNGTNTKSTDRYALKVQQVSVTTTIPQVQAWIDDAILNKTWLILMFHQIDHSGSQFSSTPELLQSIINDLQTKNASVITVAEGLALMNPGSPLTPDNVKPIITLNGSQTININVGSSYTDAGATAFDNVDGDLTSAIITSNPVNTSLAGVYVIKYNVSDLAGNSALEITRTVNVNAIAPPPPPPSTNLVSNPSLETASGANPLNWFTGGWGTNTRTFTYPVAGNGSARAVKVQITKYTNGDAKWYFKEVPATPATTYTFSDSYLSTVASEPTVRFKLANGSFQYKTLAVLPASPTAFTTKSFAFTTPANTVSITVFHLIAKVGSLTIDDASITK